MNLWIRVATPLMIVLSFALNAKAQYAANYGMAGTGVYGGMQQCPYNYGAGQAATSEDDEVAEIQNDIAELKKEKAEKRAELKKAERDMKYAKRDIEDVVADNYAQTLFEHMDGPKGCDEYAGYSGNTQDGGNGYSAKGEIEGSEGSGNQQKPAELPKAGDFSIDQWNGTINNYNYVCNKSQKGMINPAACYAPFQVKDRKPGSLKGCTEGLKTYSASTQKANRLRDELDQIERSLEYSKDKLKDARKDALQARQDAQREQTEAGVCPTCAMSGNGYTYTRPQTDWTSVIANVGMGLFGTYLGYQQNKYAVDAAANLGYPMNPAPSFLMGFPYLATGLTQALGGGSGVYGAMSAGIGAGGFGCAGQAGGPMGMYGPMGGANGPGMWGNPYMMGSPMGGGLYAGGQGPWGMSGPMGMMGGGFPGGYAGYAGMPGFAGSLNAGFASGGYAGMPGYAGYAGMPGYAGYAGMGFANGFAGQLNAGFATGYAGFAGMPGYTGGFAGMAGGYAGMPGGFAGMAGGFAGMAGGYAGMAGGFAGMAGGYAGMPGYAGYAGGYASGLAGDMGMMQMQQQMMQMQMQQQQAYMQSQMQRQQTVISLMSEINAMSAKLGYVLNGGSLGTSYIGGSGSTGYYNTGYGTTTTMPGGVIMGGSGTATTPIGTGVTVPGSVPIINNGTSTGVGTGR